MSRTAGSKNVKKSYKVTNDIIYRTWYSMKQRCYNPNNSMFKYYGGRSNPIGICEEWLSNYQAFENWALTHGWDYGLEIDRIDNSAGYSESNCRWSTDLEQQNNTSYNHPITIDGVTKNLKQWARENKIHYTTILSRIKRGLEGLDLIKPTNYKSRLKLNFG